MASTISKMTTAQVAALTTTQIAALQSTDVAALTAAMIDAMDLNPSDGQFETLTSKQITGLSNLAVAALSSTQLNQLTTATFAALSKTQISYINTAEISGLDATHIKALTSVQISGLTTGEISKLVPTQISSLSTAAVAALTSTQLGAFAAAVDKTSGADVTGKIASLTPTQFAALSSAALPGLDTADIAVKDAATGNWLGVTTAQLNALTSKQVPGLAVDDLGKFAAAQFNALSTDAFSALSKNQIAAINTAQISGLDANHIAALTSAQVSGLSSGAMGKLSSAQVSKFDVDALTALTSAQLSGLANGVIKGFTADQFASLASSALPGLDAADITSLADGSTVSNSLLAALTSKQTPGLATADLALFTADQLNHIDPTAFAALSKTQIAAIATDQIQNLDADHIAVLTSAQIAGLTTKAIAALDDGVVTGQIVALPTAVISAMSADQFNALGADGVAALTSDQFAALSSKALAGLTSEDVMTYASTNFASSVPSSSAPVLVSSSPRDNSTSVAPNDNIVLTFSEDVELGMGNIMLDGSASDIDIPVVGGSAFGTITVDGRTVTIDPASDLLTTQTYDLSIDATAIYDKAGNAYAGILDADTTTLNFEIAPVLTAAQATAGTPAAFLGTGTNTAFPIADTIKLTFSEDMARGTGNIIISDGASDIRTIPVSDTTQVTIGAALSKTVTIDPTANFNPGTTYFVQMVNGVLTAADATLTPFAGVSDNTTLDFVTAADILGPTATQWPTTGTTPVAPNANIVLTMSENVTAVAGKTVEIWQDGGTPALIESFAATDSEISIAGKYVTINPTNDFTNTKVYYVKAEAGAFIDASGNGNLAYDLNTSKFTISTGTADSAALVFDAASTIGALTPIDNKTEAVVNADLTLKFDDVVLPGAGTIVFRSADGSDIRTIDVTDSSQVSFDTTTKSAKINPTSDLHSNTLYSVQITNGALIDNYNHAYAGISDTTTMNFTTIDVVPYVVSSSPTDNSGATATPIALNSNIVLTFNEPVLANSTAKNITLTPKVDGTAVAASTLTIASNSSQVSIHGNVVTINPSADLIPNATYELTAEAAAFKDIDPGAGGTNAVFDSAAIVALSGIDFKTTDTFAPELTFINDKATTLAVKSVLAADDLVLTFTENVMRGSGDIIIAPLSPSLPSDPVLRFAITDTTQVTIDATNRIVTIAPTDATALAATAEYSVIIDDTVILDAEGNPAPTLASAVLGAGTSVSNGKFTSIAAAGSDLKLQFSEEVKAGSGNIIISNGAGDTHILSVTDSNQVMFNPLTPTIVTLNPIKDLIAGDAYSITMGSGVITDLQGNAYDAPTDVTWGFTTDRMALISAAQIPGLSAEVITALNSAQVAALKPESIAALSAAQITALDPYDVAAMSIDQFAAISTAGITGLEASDITALAQIPGATDRITAITAAQAPLLSNAVVGALNTMQVSALSVEVLGALTSAQLGAMEPTAISSMTFDQFAALNPAALASLDSTDIDALDASNTGQIAAITAAQIATISADAIASLNSTQISALTTEAFAALSSAQLAAIDIGALPGVTTAQISNMACNHQDFTDTQVMALTTAQLHALEFSTPLVLDLGGNGIETSAVQNGVVFDLAGDGSAAQVGWVAPSDGLLVIDVNSDGVINDGSELFGEGTRLADGSTAADGFAALAALNSNGDAVIDANDAAFSQLQVWQDVNQDGVSDANELLALNALNIVSFALDAEETSVVNEGNVIKLAATYTTADGVTHQLADVWLAGVVESTGTAEVI